MYTLLTMSLLFSRSILVQGLTYWDEGTKEDFEFILGGAADLASCNLAVVCDRPCREVGASAM